MTLQTAGRHRPPLKDVIGGQKVRFATANDLADQLLGVFLELRSHQGPDRKHPQCVIHRQGAFSRVLVPVERGAARTALALAVEVDAPNLAGEGIHQLADLCRISAEDAQLLPEVRLQHIVDDRLQIAVRHHR
ncbi:MAG: hypothetical protein JWQ20_4478 [Conexibacter sp.]|nr:hypothetical protein [Conexibacter sp.]